MLRNFARLVDEVCPNWGDAKKKKNTRSYFENFTKMQDVLNLIFGGILDIDFEQDIVGFSSGQP